MAGKLTEEQKQEIVRRYEAGESACHLGFEYEVAANSIYKVLRKKGVVRRTHSEAALLQYGKCEVRPTPDALREAYTGLGSKYPSAAELGRRYGVSGVSIKKWLKEANVSIRTPAAQQALDVKFGRRNPPVPTNNTGHGRDMMLYIRGLRSKESYKESGLKNSIRFRNRAIYPCYWCSKPVEAIPSRAKTGIVYCSQYCSGKGNRFRQCKGGESRPLILQRLREILQEQRFRALPRTLETLEKAGEPIGSGFEEYWEIMQSDWGAL